MDLTTLTAQFLGYLKNERRFSSNTLVSYSTDLSQFTEWLVKTYEINDATAIDHPLIRSWVVNLVDSGKDSATVNRKISAVKSFFKYLCKISLLATNPTDRINLLKKKERLPSFIDKNKLNGLLDESLKEVAEDSSFTKIRNHLIVELFFSTGMRLSELGNLKTSDINLEKQTFKVTGKRNKERIIPGNEAIFKMVKGYLGVRESGKMENEFLFVTIKDKKLNSKAIYRIVTRLLSGIPGIKKRNPHILRHSFATAMLNNGADINAVKEFLGHSSLAATQVYTHNTIEKLLKSYKLAHPRA
ncbi:MAG: tyrosine-type recombinase/integrase [Bacteroidetes bacterium]|nr:tyrosine-type recombinase/integrase [Bacteroidota bacterium]